MGNKQVIEEFFEAKSVHRKSIRINDECLNFIEFFNENTRYINIGALFKFIIKYLLMNPLIIKDMFGKEVYTKYIKRFNLHEHARDESN